MVDSIPVIFRWCLAVLAVYRLAYLVTIDNGPAYFFLRLRISISQRYGPASWQAEGASCFFCQSVWYAALAAFWVSSGGPAEYLILWLSIAGACVVIHWMVLTWMAQINR